MVPLHESVHENKKVHIMGAQWEMHLLPASPRILKEIETKGPFAFTILFLLFYFLEVIKMSSNNGFGIIMDVHMR